MGRGRRAGERTGPDIDEQCGADAADDGEPVHIGLPLGSVRLRMQDAVTLYSIEDASADGQCNHGERNLPGYGYRLRVRRGRGLIAIVRTSRRRRNEERRHGSQNNRRSYRLKNPSFSIQRRPQNLQFDSLPSNRSCHYHKPLWHADENVFHPAIENRRLCFAFVPKTQFTNQ